MPGLDASGLGRRSVQAPWRATARATLLNFAAVAAGAVALALGPAPARADSPFTSLAVGAALGVAAPVGNESAGVGAGYAVRPRVAYELPIGIAPTLAISYARWGGGETTRWELSGLAGLRWTILPERFAPWVEAALGYGQLVHERWGRVDIGPRALVGLGFDYALAPWARLEMHVAGNQLYGGGVPGFDSTWLELGAGVTLRPF